MLAERGCRDRAAQGTDRQAQAHAVRSQVRAVAAADRDARDSTRGSGCRARRSGCAARAGPRCKRVQLKRGNGRFRIKTSASCASATRGSRTRVRVELPDCGQPMQTLGEDVSEQLGRASPAAFRVIRTIRRKLVCPCCSTITQPPDARPADPAEHRASEPAGGHSGREVRRPPALVSAIGDRGATAWRWTGPARAAGSASARRCSSR